MGDAIETDRLRLRGSTSTDRDVVIEMATDREVRAYLGGSSNIATVEQGLEQPTPIHSSTSRRYLITDRETDQVFGTVEISRRAADRPGHVLADGNELELSYTLRRSAWGHGFATEAAQALLVQVANAEPDQPVLILTQTANQRSLKLARRLGFILKGTFVEFGAEQTMAVASLHMFARSRGRCPIVPAEREGDERGAALSEHAATQIHPCGSL